MPKARDHRTYLTFNWLTPSFCKRMKLRLERDRVKSFKGQIVTSSVLQGAPMQYVYGDFMKKLDAAIVECEAVVSESKFCLLYTSPSPRD